MKHGVLKLVGSVQELCWYCDHLIPISHLWSGRELLGFSEKAALMHLIARYRQVNPVNHDIAKFANQGTCISHNLIAHKAAYLKQSLWALDAVGAFDLLVHWRR